MTRKSGSEPTDHFLAEGKNKQVRDRRELVLFFLALGLFSWMIFRFLLPGTLQPAARKDLDAAHLDTLAQECTGAMMRRNCTPDDLFFLARPMPLDRATAADLDLLPAIGPVLARRIITARDRGSLSTAKDLEKIPGISAAKARQLAPFLDFSSLQRP